jgi:hypothetical protein
MHGFDNFGISAQDGESNISFSPQKLDGKDALMRCVMYAMMSASTQPFSDVGLEEEIWSNLSDIANFSNGAMDGEWLCFNIETGELGMAFRYKDNWRIRAASITDEQLKNLQQERMISRIKDLEGDDDND